MRQVSQRFIAQKRRQLFGPQLGLSKRFCFQYTAVQTAIMTCGLCTNNDIGPPDPAVVSVPPKEAQRLVERAPCSAVGDARIRQDILFLCPVLPKSCDSVIHCRCLFECWELSTWRCC